MPGSLVQTLAGLPGVARADGNVTDPTTFVVSKQGQADRRAVGRPGSASRWNDAPTTGGEPPASDRRRRGRPGRARSCSTPAPPSRAGYVVGDTRHARDAAGASRRSTATLVGIADFKGGTGRRDAGLVRHQDAPRTSTCGGKDDVLRRVGDRRGRHQRRGPRRAPSRPSLPKGFEAVTGASAAEEQATGINEALCFFNIFLLVFAGIALFVGSFLIINTFSILVAQRSRELALLRALGAAGAR